SDDLTCDAQLRVFRLARPTATRSKARTIGPSARGSPLLKERFSNRCSTGLPNTELPTQPALQLTGAATTGTGLGRPHSEPASPPSHQGREAGSLLVSASRTHWGLEEEPP